MNDQPPILPYDDTQVTSNPAPLDEAAITAKVEQRLRQQLAELSEVAAQAQRLGVAVDPAQALARGITPDALRQSVLKQAAERDIAADISASEKPPASKGLAITVMRGLLFKPWRARRCRGRPVAGV